MEGLLATLGGGIVAYNLENYEDVDTRIHKFWDAHPHGRITTEVTHLGTSTEGRVVQVIITATVFGSKDDLVPTSTGIAEETLGSSPVNKTSFIENCETSAIGRALANAGYSTKGARPSRTEMSKATRSKEMDEGWPPPEGNVIRRDFRVDDTYAGETKASDAQRKKLYAVAKNELALEDEQFKDWIQTTVERGPDSSRDLTKGEASMLIDIAEGRL